MVSDIMPTIGKNGSADIIAPPGAPGAATMAIPRTAIKPPSEAKSVGKLYISKTAMAVEMIAIILPAK